MNFPLISLKITHNTKEQVASVFAYESSFLSHCAKYTASCQNPPSREQRVWHFFGKYLQRKSAFYLLLFSGLLFVFPVDPSFSAEAQTMRTFIATAYYSPLPDQENYYLGSYEKDKRLNGGGERAADGTPVYAGMIAAPKTYPFGTKIELEGLGVVAVHDRGGAIVAAEDGRHAYDRIDIWMGHGDEALKRTIAWGKRELLGKIVDAQTAVDVNLEQIVDAAPKVLDVARKKLRALGYEKTGQDMASMIMQFQLDHGVIAHAGEAGAGNYGPKTTRALAEAYERLMASSPALATATTGDQQDMMARHHEVSARSVSVQSLSPKERAEQIQTVDVGKSGP